MTVLTSGPPGQKRMSTLMSAGCTPRDACTNDETPKKTTLPAPTVCVWPLRKRSLVQLPVLLSAVLRAALTRAIACTAGSHTTHDDDDSPY